jgi:hypothetical protein
VREPTVRLNSRALSARPTREAGLWSIDFEKMLSLTPGTKLTVAAG